MLLSENARLKILNLFRAVVSKRSDIVYHRRGRVEEVEQSSTLPFLTKLEQDDKQRDRVHVGPKRFLSNLEHSTLGTILLSHIYDHLKSNKMKSTVYGEN